MTSTTRTTVDISDAPRYLKQLCRHFGHKVDATFAEDGSAATVDFGDEVVARFAALEPTRLELEVTAPDAETAARYAGVVDRHLAKFAFREELAFNWSEPAPVA